MRIKKWKKSTLSVLVAVLCFIFAATMMVGAAELGAGGASRSPSAAGNAPAAVFWTADPASGPSGAA